jgi:hypothetical protein
MACVLEPDSPLQSRLKRPHFSLPARASTVEAD